MAAKSQPKAAICPLFPGTDPPVLAEDCHRFEVHVLLGSRTGSGVPGVEIDLKDDEFTRANDGEEYAIDPYQSTTLELANILKVRELDREAGEVPFYRVDAFVDGNNKPIGTHRLAVKARYSDENEEDAPEEDEEERRKKAMPAMYPQDAAMRLNEKMMTMFERNARDARTEPLQMLAMVKQLTSDDGKSVALVDTLREELKSARTRHETETSEKERKHDRELDLLRDQLRKERDSYDRDRDEWRRDLRETREKSEREMTGVRAEAAERIYKLQEQNLKLQQDSQMAILVKTQELMEERVTARLAQREVEDAKMALESAEETLGEQLKGAAAGMEEVPGWVKMMLPFAKPLLDKFMASGQPLPTNPQEVQQLVDRIQIPPVQASYPQQQNPMHNMTVVTPPPESHLMQQEPAVRTQQPRMTPTHESEEPDESDDEDSEEDESDSEENAAE